MTDTDDVHKTRHDFLIVHAAVMPTRVLPAPQGRTIIPERARLSGEIRWEYARMIDRRVLPVTKHLTQGLDLIRSNVRSWFQINVQVGI